MNSQERAGRNAKENSIKFDLYEFALAMRMCDVSRSLVRFSATNPTTESRGEHDWVNNFFGIIHSYFGKSLAMYDHTLYDF